MREEIGEADLRALIQNAERQKLEDLICEQCEIDPLFKSKVLSHTAADKAIFEAAKQAYAKIYHRLVDGLRYDYLDFDSERDLHGALYTVIEEASRMNDPNTALEAATFAIEKAADLFGYEDEGYMLPDIAEEAMQVVRSNIERLAKDPKVWGTWIVRLIDLANTTYVLELDADTAILEAAVALVDTSNSDMLLQAAHTAANRIRGRADFEETIRKKIAQHLGRDAS